MQWCSRAQETDPICSGPGCVVRNSSQWGPQGLCTPPLPLHLLHLCLIAERVGNQGQELNPREGGWGGGGGWARALMERVSMKWPSGSDASWACFTLAWAYGWGWVRVGSFSNEGGSEQRDYPGCYCMFCLVSHQCATEIESHKWEWDLLAVF